MHWYRIDLRDRKRTALGEVKKNSFITLPDKGGHSGLQPQKTVSQLGEDSETFYSNCPKRAKLACGHSSDGLVVR